MAGAAVQDAVEARGKRWKLTVWSRLARAHRPARVATPFRMAPCREGRGGDRSGRDHTEKELQGVAGQPHYDDKFNLPEEGGAPRPSVALFVAPSKCRCQATKIHRGNSFKSTILV